GVCDKHRAIRANRETLRKAQVRADRRTAVPRIIELLWIRSACESLNDPVGPDAAHAVCRAEVDAAVASYGDIVRARYSQIQRCLSGRSAVSGVDRGPGSSNGTNVAVGPDPADPIAAREIERAIGAESHPPVQGNRGVRRNSNGIVTIRLPVAS